MAVASWTRLTDRGVVEVGGEEAGDFLQNLVTNDVDDISPQGAGYGALLSPQGKVQFDFLMFRDGDRFWFDLPRERAAAFAQRMAFYRLRRPVEIEDRSADYEAIALWGEDLPTIGQAVAYASDPRLGALGHRAIIVAGTTPEIGEEVDRQVYDRRRIELGVPDGGADFAYEAAFPHDADIDQLHGIDFAKGCYVGQEIVSRMEHRGTARRRVVRIAAGHDLTAGAEITAAGQAIGTVGSVDGARGLAMVRIDRVGHALDAGTPITAEGGPVELAVPEWAHFTWTSGESGAAP